MPARRIQNVVYRAINRRHSSSQTRQVYNAFISYDDELDGKEEEKPTWHRGVKARHIAIKDNICTTDFPTTCASRILHFFWSPYDATVVSHLRKAGVVICGKTNMDEFGMGTYSTHSYFGPVRNLGRDGNAFVAGGSSGGSAVAVATEQAWAALGTDTGGSVRMPAAMTGVYGFKPSYGLLSRWGVVAYANSLDTVGILANSTADIREVFKILNVYDANDPTSLSTSTRRRIQSASLMYGRWLYNSILAEQRDKRFIRPLRIGVPQEYNVAELSSPVRTAWSQMLQQLQAQGHEIVPVSLPSTKQALAAYYVIAPAEASSNLAKYDGVRYGWRADGSDGAGGVLFSKTRGEGFGAEVKRRILLGTYSLSSEAIDNYFIQAQKVRRLVQRDFDDVFSFPNMLHTETVGLMRWTEGVDVLVCPTAPKLPPTLEEVHDLDSIQEYVNDVLTVPASLAGLPAISIPFKLRESEKEDGMESEGPVTVGMQIIGQFGQDNLVLDVADMLERSEKKRKDDTSKMSFQPLTPRNEASVVSKDDKTQHQNGRAASPNSHDVRPAFDQDLAQSYVRMRNTYGNNLKAVQYNRRGTK